LPTVFLSVSATLLLCYVATLVTAYLHILPMGHHMLWGLFMTILMVLLQCLIFGFFIGSGKTIKRVAAEAGLGSEWAQKTKDYKNRCYPPLMLAILATACAGIVGGGIALGIVSLWVHQVLVWIALVLNLRSFWISYRVISENVRAIHEMNDLIRSGKAPGRSRGPKAARTVMSESQTPLRTHRDLYFLSIAVWVPYLYMKFSLGSRTFPLWPFLAGSLLLFALGWMVSRRSVRG